MGRSIPATLLHRGDFEMSNEHILDEVRTFVSLRQVIDWSLRQKPPAEFVDVVVQDEFHHDVIVRVAADRFAVFETS
jgi:hypothetical protein